MENQLHALGYILISISLYGMWLGSWMYLNLERDWPFIPCVLMGLFLPLLATGIILIN